MQNNNLMDDHYLYHELLLLIKNDESIFNFIENSTLDGIWYWDLENPENEWMSPSFWKTLGYDPSTKSHLTSEWQDIINEDDLKLAVENFKKHIDNPSFPYDQLVRYKHKSGQIIWIRCRGIAIRNENGKAIRMLGAHTDVTALKEQEQLHLEKERAQRLSYQKQALLLDELEKTANIGTWELDLCSNQLIWSYQTKIIHDVPYNYNPTLETAFNFYKGMHKDQIKNSVDLCKESGHGWEHELELVTFKGRHIWVRVIGRPISVNGTCTKVFGVIQDISTQKLIESELESARLQAEANAIRLQLAHDSIGMGVFEWDCVNDKLLWDKWMYNLYQVSESKFTGAFEAWENSVHPDDIQQAKYQLSNALNEGVDYDTSFRIILGDKTTKHIKANAIVIRDENNKPIRVIGVNYDISQKENAIAELEREKLNAESSARAKSSFLANMSHEIRTPMNAILGGLQILETSITDVDLLTIIKNASSSAKSLLTIINDILDFSKIESEKLTFEETPFNLLDILDDVKFSVDTLVSVKNINFSIEVNKDFNDGWIGDPVRIKQILVNLVSNAVKFTEHGSVKVHISSVNDLTSSAVYIDVIDTGIGMPPEVVKKLFDRFTQADASTTRKYGGTGLGMSICNSLIQLMHGSIDVLSEPDKGTSISITLPLKKTQKEVVVNKQSKIAPPLLVDKNILIAEDNKINQTIISAMLASTKAKVTIVENGKLALDAVKNNHFDLVLMDIQMPEMDGEQAKKAISTIDPTLPIVALTANVMPEHIERYMSQGFIGHLGKPIDMNLLFNVLKKFIR